MSMGDVVRLQQQIDALVKTVELVAASVANLNDRIAALEDAATKPQQKPRAA